MKNKGFTLIELFIAISIFAVVAIALYSTFFAGISVWRRSGKGQNTYQDVRLVFDDMTKDFRNMIYCSEDEESLFAFEGKAGEIAFITLEDSFSEEDIPRRELVKVKYSLGDEKNQLLRKRAGMDQGFDLGNAEEEILLEGAEGFELAYCHDSGDEDDPYLWEEEWNDDKIRIPRGIKVTLRVRPEEKEELKFSKTIFVPAGVLGKKALGL